MNKIKDRIGLINFTVYLMLGVVLRDYLSGLKRHAFFLFFSKILIVLLYFFPKAAARLQAIEEKISNSRRSCSITPLQVSLSRQW